MVSIINNSGKSLIWIDYHLIKGPVKFERHHHAFLELSCVMRGTGTYHVNGVSYDMRPGDVFLFSPTDHHALELHNEQLEHIVIHMDPSFIWNALSNDMDYKFLMVFFQRSPQFGCRLDRDNPAGRQIVQWFREIWQESREQQDCYELMIKIRLQSILAQIIRSYDCIDRSKATRPVQTSELRSMNEVLSFIDEHLSEEIRLADLAAIAHVSPSYFSTLFKQYNGLPPVEFVVGQRVRRAIEYIRTTDMALPEVAAACGFNNNTNFYKAFRRITGRTPAYYRRPIPYEDSPYVSAPMPPQATFFDNENRPAQSDEEELPPLPNPPPPPPPPVTAPSAFDPCAAVTPGRTVPIDPCAAFTCTRSVQPDPCAAVTGTRNVSVDPCAALSLGRGNGTKKP